MTLTSLSSLGNRKPPFLRAVPVYIFSILLLLASIRPLDFTVIDNIHVIFFLVPLYYWVIYQPLLMPLWFVFLAGLAIDFMIDGLLGLHAFSFVAYYSILYQARRIILSQPLLYQGVIYAFTAFGFEALRWIIISLLTMHPLSFMPSLVSWVINIVVFPLIFLVLKALHKILSTHA